MQTGRNQEGSRKKTTKKRQASGKETRKNWKETAVVEREREVESIGKGKKRKREEKEIQTGSKQEASRKKTRRKQTGRERWAGSKREVACGVLRLSPGNQAAVH